MRRAIFHRQGDACALSQTPSIVPGRLIPRLLVGAALVVFLVGAVLANRAGARFDGLVFANGSCVTVVNMTTHRATLTNVSRDGGRAGNCELMQLVAFGRPIAKCTTDCRVSVESGGRGRVVSRSWPARGATIASEVPRAGWMVSLVHVLTVNENGTTRDRVFSVSGWNI